MISSKKPRRRSGALATPQVRGAVAGVAIIVALVLVAFGRGELTGGGREVRAIFASGSQLKSGSEVRVSGLAIGSVERVEATPEGRALVTMRLDDDAPVLRADAEMAIKPRLAFEGNFVVDVTPGSPTRPPLGAGDTVPESHTTVPVQIDQLLSTFTLPVRKSATAVVGDLAAGLGAGTSPVAPDSRDTGTDGLRRANRELAKTLTSVSRTARALRGTRPGDLQRAIRSTANLADTVARDPAALAAIMGNYARFAGALSANDHALGASFRGLDSVLRTSPASLTKLDRALPRVRTLATALRPAVRALPAATRPIDRALRQVEGFSGPRELPALVSRLNGPVRALPELQQRIGAALPALTSVARCLDNTVVPTLEQTVPDGHLSTGQPAWLEALHMAANLAGGSQGFDANGTTIRAGLGNGDANVRGLLPGIGPVVTEISGGLTGIRPVWLGPNQVPIKRPDIECGDQPRIALKSRTGVRNLGLRSLPAPAPDPDRGKSPAQRRKAARAALLKAAEATSAGVEKGEDAR